MGPIKTLDMHSKPTQLVLVALLTQSGVLAPTARVLNKDGYDYLPGVTFTNHAVGELYIHHESFTQDRIYYSPNLSFVSPGILALRGAPAEVGYDDFASANIPVMIAVRQYGDAPVILSALTKADGSAVDVLFSQSMDADNLALLVDNVTVNEIAVTGITVVSDYVLSFELETALEPEVPVTIDFIEANGFQSVNYGQLQEVTFPVVNETV